LSEPCLWQGFFVWKPLLLGCEAAEIPEADSPPTNQQGPGAASKSHLHRRFSGGQEGVMLIKTLASRRTAPRTPLEKTTASWRCWPEVATGRDRAARQGGHGNASHALKPWITGQRLGPRLSACRWRSDVPGRCCSHRLRIQRTRCSPAGSSCSGPSMCLWREGRQPP